MSPTAVRVSRSEAPRTLALAIASVETTPWRHVHHFLHCLYWGW
jgi:hypothetical protein